MIARGFVEAGAKVYISSRKAEVCDEVAEELSSVGEAVSIPADLSTEAECRRLAESVAERESSLDILVNNAGATWGAPAEDHPLEAWDKVMNLNVRSVFLMSQAIGRASMIPRRYGRIVNVASIAGLAGSGPGMTVIAYGTSKGAVVNFTRTLAGEWGRYGITVNALAPGFFPSKMTRGTLATVGADTLAAGAPLGRLGDDDDLKGAALLFASAAGKHITGQILAVDGGVSAVHVH
jgi:gluconate 5-dehydrogenase